ncbi:MAG: DNA polymerase III subunit alpha [Pirellulaceae bacterium]|nr:DNA polymerase III subunit alpha [Pirellulaceae bacterium]
MSRRFVHLHCHSHYSLLDGASSIDKLIAKAKANGMNALALTDHGNLHGALEFYQKAKKADINPIIGYEAYVAPESRWSRGNATSSKEAAFHLTLLAQNRVGFQNLIKLASKASLEGFYFKPRIDRELLADLNEGIICLSGCVSSEFSRAILNNGNTAQGRRQASEVAKWFHQVFGNRYYVEVMNNHLEIQRLQMEGALSIADELGLPVVATSDAHYANREDAEIQDVLLCINTGKFRTDSARLKMEGNEFYLRSAEEMYACFPGREDIVARSQEIADTVDIDLQLGKRHFPTYPLPVEKKPDDYLREICEAGLRERYRNLPDMCVDGQLSQTVRERLDRELLVIQKLGFANYFLIVWDFVRYARQQKVPATARGSGVGALVCYALYLSHVCPIKYDLLFERFLDENRLEAPDIDIDFCKDRRADIIQYVRDKYGEENVAQIGTFGTMAAKAAIKDVGRALGIPLARVNQITELVPEELKITISKALDKKDSELQALYQSDHEVRELLDIAMQLEGNARNVGTHAAAVVIGDKPLTEYVPLGRVSGKTDIITQWSMSDVEAAGLLKMDFLGLRNLTILTKSLEIIQQTTGHEVDLLNLPLDDQKSFALLQRGETKGVFQLESGGIRDLLQRMKPDHFSDIIATNALYRPGPLEGGMVDDYVAVKHGRKQAEYLHPVLKEILQETNGVMVYQEQVMRILNRLGGIELANAYTCIKAISKKKESIIAANEEQFLRGATEKGLKQSQAREMWGMILKFAGYGFNKSHSTAYALIAYQTAFLKAHYPVEFMAALLSGDIPGRNFKHKDSLVEHLEDCRRMNIHVVPPDVNRSHVDFTVHDSQIVFGLAAIKGCGGAAGDSIVKARQQAGPFQSIFDFCERVDPTECNRATIETLIKAGAFDSTGAERGQLLAVVEKALQAGAAKLADRRSGQMSFFDELDDEAANAPQSQPLPSLPPLPERTKLAMEREVLGMYLSAHPLDEYQGQLSQLCSHTSSQLGTVKDRSEVLVGGMISSIKLANTRNPKPGAPSRYANFDLEDWDGIVRCICWPDGYQEYGHLIQPESIVIMRATLDKRGGSDVNLLANEIIPIEDADQHFSAGLRIHLHEQVHSEATVRALNEILRGYPGNLEISLMVTLASGEAVQMAARKHRVRISPELRERLSDLLGPENHRLLVAPPKPKSPGTNGRSRPYNRQ